MQSETFTTQAMQTFSAVLLVTREYRYQTSCHEFHSHYCKCRRSAKLPLILKLKAELVCCDDVSTLYTSRVSSMLHWV